MRRPHPFPLPLPAALFALGLSLGIAAAPARAQNAYPTPRLEVLTPPGGKAGTTVEVTFGGRDLDEPAEILFSHPGLKARRLPDPKPDPKQKNPPPPPVRYEVSIAPDTPVGIYDVRLVGKWGVSNPRAFAVGDLNEAAEKEPNNDVDQPQKLELNTTVSGAVSAPTDVDYFSFAGKKDRRVLVRCRAEAIDSRLTPDLRLFGPDGRLVAEGVLYSDGDAVLDCIPPADGDYLIRLCQQAYQGGSPEFFYRLSVTDAPWIDAVFPPVVEAGKPSQVTLLGRNLPGGQPSPDDTVGGRPLEQLAVTVAAPPPDGRLDYGHTLPPRSGAIDGFGYEVRNASGVSNQVLLGYARAPVVLSGGNNRTPEQAQEIALPCEVCGRLRGARDRDWFRFDARQGEVFYFEGYADRLGAPLDLYFMIRRADNKQVLGYYDAHSEIPTRAGTFYTHSDDPVARFQAPADGKYELMVASRSADRSAPHRLIYRLSCRRPEPDFRLVLVGNPDPSVTGCTVRQGSSQDLLVVCYRRDGFDGEVNLELEGLPAGVTCPPQVLGPKQEETRLVVTAAADAPAGLSEIKIKGTATIDGKPVTREARHGCQVWPTNQQGNIPAVSRMCRGLYLAVREKGPFGLTTSTPEVAVPVGGNATVKYKLDGYQPDFKANVQLRRLSAPVLENNGNFINVPNVNIAVGKEAEVKFNVPRNTKPGTYNFVMQGFVQYQFQKDPKAKKENVQVFQATPPVKFVVYDRAAEAALSAAKVAVPAGGKSELTVKLNRLFGYKGEFEIQLVPPQGFQGISAPSVKVPGDAGEAKLVLQAAGNAKPAGSPGFKVRVSAKVENVTLNDELPLEVSIVPPPPKPQALLPEGADGWKYAPAESVKGDDWRNANFDDSKWAAGKAPLGNGEGAINERKGTTIPDFQRPHLFRRVIEVPKELLDTKGVSFRLSIASDNSAEVYLNGKLVDKDPNADHEFAYWNREVTLKPEQFTPGRNVLAVRVDNGSGSSDLYLDAKLETIVPGKK